MGSVAVVDLDATQVTKPWAFLPTNLLHDVSGHLRDARDFVRYHAVCRPWREAAPAPARLTFRPWLVLEHPGPGNHMLTRSPVIYSGSVVSPDAASRNRRSYDNTHPVLAPSDMILVTSEDGEAVWRLAIRGETTLEDVFTGAVTLLPPFPADDYGYGVDHRMTKPRGVVYGDGTIFLYSYVPRFIADTHDLTAAMLRPGDTTWTIMKRRLDLPAACNLVRAAYHDGNVLVWVGCHLWCVVTQDPGADGSDVYGIRRERTDDRHMEKRYMCVSNHVFEAHGELLRASVLLDREWNMDTNDTNNSAMIPPITVTVHALEKEEETDDGIRSGMMRWVEKDGLDWISPDAHVWPTIAPIEDFQEKLIRILPDKNT